MGGFSVQPTGQQTMTMREVDQFIQEARSAPTTKSPRILGINMAAMMKAKNNGYPKHMYHATLDMRLALKEEEEMALVQLGYQTQYVPRAYPKTLFRRNMEARFEPAFDPASGIQINTGFVEERPCRDEKQEREMRLMKVKPGTSQWFEKVTDIPEIEEGPSEDPKTTIARLEGQVAGLQSEIAKPKGKRESVTA